MAHAPHPPSERPEPGLHVSWGGFAKRVALLAVANAALFAAAAPPLRWILAHA